MSRIISDIPTPNEWIEKKLRELRMSIAALARMLGHDRAQVQRWVNGREQIPRHHLAEMAAQLGTQTDLEYALKLKEYEDFADSLRRRIRELSRIGKMDVEETESAVFELLQRKTADEEHNDPGGYTSALLYNITHASFIIRLWQDAAAEGDFSSILTRQNLKLHIQYPANHFLGLALRLPMRDRMADAREQCLGSLRRIATEQAEGDPTQISYRHHAMHIIGRYGTEEDQAFVAELLRDSLQSSDPVAVRLGYSGLTLHPGHQALAEQYVCLLERNPTLADVDLAFDAVHYGDCRLTQALTLPKRVPGVTNSVTNLVRRLSQPGDYQAIQVLDMFRLCMLLELAPVISEGPTVNMTTAKRALEYVQTAERSRFTSRAEVLVARLIAQLESDQEHAS
jgi:plasmid maintenance system antidote protein VapI